MCATLASIQWNRNSLAQSQVFGRSAFLRHCDKHSVRPQVFIRSCDNSSALSQWNCGRNPCDYMESLLYLLHWMAPEPINGPAFNYTASATEQSRESRKKKIRWVTPPQSSDSTPSVLLCVRARLSFIWNTRALYKFYSELPLKGGGRDSIALTRQPLSKSTVSHWEIWTTLRSDFHQQACQRGKNMRKTTGNLIQCCHQLWLYLQSQTFSLESFSDRSIDASSNERERTKMSPGTRRFPAEIRTVLVSESLSFLLPPLHALLLQVDVDIASTWARQRRLWQAILLNFFRCPETSRRKEARKKKGRLHNGWTANDGFIGLLFIILRQVGENGSKKRWSPSPSALKHLLYLRWEEHLKTSSTIEASTTLLSKRLMNRRRNVRWTTTQSSRWQKLRSNSVSFFKEKFTANVDYSCCYHVPGLAFFRSWTIIMCIIMIQYVDTSWSLDWNFRFFTISPSPQFWMQSHHQILWHLSSIPRMLPKILVSTNEHPSPFPSKQLLLCCSCWRGCPIV